MANHRIMLATLLISTLACAGEPMTVGTPLPSLSDVTPAEWKALAARRVFFGHQSVGGNVATGLSEVLESHPEVELQVVESKELGPRATPGFYHALVGQNGDPGEKVDEFVRIAIRDLEVPGSVGIVKFCYVDVEVGSDAHILFADYQRKMADLRARNPALTLVHFTMPLVVDEGWVRYSKDKVLGRDTKQTWPGGTGERDRNVVRNRYNELLREAYVGKEPVFDVATLESTRPDGSRTFFRRWGKPVFVLAPEMTTDGGHLSEPARRLIAEQLLILLAKLPAPSQGTAS